jgi:paraquat-inducible protein B
VKALGAERQTAIGAFVFGGFILALAAIIMFGNFRFFSSTTRAAVVFQGSISGLSIGAPVTFRGVRIGSVQSIMLQFDAQNSTAYIPVIIQLQPDRIRVTGEKESRRTAVNLSKLVARGLRAELVTQSFVTGQSEINLDFYPAAPAALHPNVTDLPEIPTRLSTVQRVQEELSKLPLRELVENANATLQSLQHLSNSLDEQLPPLVANLQVTAQESSRAVTTATDAITQLQRRLNDTLMRATQLLATGDRQISERGADLHTLLVSSTQAARQASEALNEVRSLTSSRSETRVNLDSTLRDLAATASSLRGFASDIERNPQLLLTGRRP